MPPSLHLLLMVTGRGKAEWSRGKVCVVRIMVSFDSEGEMGGRVCSE